MKHQQDVQENNGIRFPYKLHYLRALHRTVPTMELFSKLKKKATKIILFCYLLFFSLWIHYIKLVVHLQTPKVSVSK